jgi:molecular chaperone HscB
MNYFELYQIPVSFTPDLSVVKQTYYALIKQYHPDRFTHASAAAQEDALQMAAQNNKAFLVFKDPFRTFEYILQFNNIILPDEQYALPQSFLMEMMDLNEVLDECESNDVEAIATATKSVQQYLDAWDNEAKACFQQYESGTSIEDLAPQLKELYYRKKYLLRISERLFTFASPSN